MTQAPVTKRSPFSFERKEGKASGTVIFRFSGPFTARDMFESLPPVAVENLFAFQSIPGEEQPSLNILDLAEVPYMDSRGLGIIVRHYVHCRGKGVGFVAAGVTPRVLELFKITKVDGILPLAASVEDADISSN